MLILILGKFVDSQKAEKGQRRQMMTRAPQREVNLLNVMILSKLHNFWHTILVEMVKTFEYKIIFK